MILIHLNIEYLCCPIIPSVSSLRQKLSLFSPLPQRALAIDRSIRHDHSSAHSRCLRWGLHSNLWNSLNFLSVLVASGEGPGEIAKPHHTFLFRFRLRVFHALIYIILRGVEFIRVLLVRQTFQRFMISYSTVTLANLPIRRNQMRHVQATSSCSNHGCMPHRVPALAPVRWYTLRQWLVIELHGAKSRFEEGGFFCPPHEAWHAPTLRVRALAARVRMKRPWSFFVALSRALTRQLKVMEGSRKAAGERVAVKIWRAALSPCCSFLFPFCLFTLARLVLLCVIRML